MMRIAIGQFTHVTEETMTLGKQLGITSCQLNWPALPGTAQWEYEDLLALRLECEKYGMKLEALENTPFDWYLKPMLGMDGRDEQIEHYKNTIRNMGKAGIPILGYQFFTFIFATFRARCPSFRSASSAKAIIIRPK